MDIQKQSEYLIKKFNLQKDLQKFGEAHLVGSVALKTMLKRDIDFQIYTKNKPTLKLAGKIEKMFLNKGFEFVFLKELKWVGKILISVEHFIKEKRWTIDVTMAQKGKGPERDSVLLLEEFKNKLDDKKRKIIIKLKKHFFKKGLLHNSMSYYIYRAVIDGGIKNEKGMLSYLRKGKLKLEQFKKIK